MYDDDIKTTRLEILKEFGIPKDYLCSGKDYKNTDFQAQEFELESVDRKKLIGKEIRVLNLGYVGLVDFMGDDKRIVDSARISYSKGNKIVKKDADLIKYLLKNQHTSPFEQVVFVFKMKLPIFVARQLIRYRTARLNEISGRYSVLSDDFYVPDTWRIQDTKNRQGSIDHDFPSGNLLRGQYISMCEKAFSFYHELLDNGVAREMARMVLPVSTYTEWIWQIDLNNMFRVLSQRLDDHAQWETRQYAKALESFVKEIVPVSFEAFVSLHNGLK